MAGLIEASLSLSAAAAKTRMPGATPGITFGSRTSRPHPRADYASPEVSNIAESMASRADLPAQTTNWNAG